MAAEAGEFSLIVTAVESGSISAASTEFAKAFSLDETIAQQICKSAPIIFAQKLTKAEVKAITPVLSELSGKGMEFRVTARVAGKLPKVNWPSRPQFTAGGSPGVNGLAFQWDNNAFVCPSCGETFLFRRMGKLQLSDEAPTNGQVASEARPMAAAPRAAAPQPAKVGAGAKGSPAPLRFADEPAQVEGVEGLQPLAGEGESLDLPEAMEEVKLDDAPAAEPLLEEASAEPLLEEAPAEEAGEFTAAAEDAAPAPEPEVAQEEEAPAAEEAEAGELYNVFLSKITDTSKRDKAAELIAKVKGCSTNEAKELTTRLVIPLAKNVSKAKAEDILNQFKKLKIFGRMTKVK